MMTDQESPTGAAANAREYLTFTLGQENYDLDILKVREIRGYDSVTRIANTPDYVKGVINLRGTIVPILDLRIKFGLPSPLDIERLIDSGSLKFAEGASEERAEGPA